MAAEEVFQFENAARRGHVFLAGHARHRRFVQAEDVGDFTQDQWPHGDFAMLEELALAVDNGLRDAMDGIEALLDVLDQPTSLLQLGGHVAVAAPLLGENLGIQTVDAQTGIGVRVDVGRPLALELFHNHVRRDVACLDLSIASSRTRVQAGDQGLGGLQILVVIAGDSTQLGEIAGRQQFKVFLDDDQRHVAIVLVRQGLQLQAQAFLQIARTDSGRVEVLDVTQRDFELFELDLVFRRQGFPQLLQGRREVAVVVERFDQEANQTAVAFVQLGHPELPAEMLAQADVGGMGIVAVAVVVLIATGSGEGAGIGSPAIVIDFGRRTRRFDFPVLARLALFAAFAARLLVARGIELLRVGKGLRPFIFAFQHGIFEQITLDFLLHFNGRQLQQLDRLLELGRQRQMLG